MFSFNIVKEVYKAPLWVHRLMLTARILLKGTVESYVDHHIVFKLAQVTQEHRLVSLIHLLRGTYHLCLSNTLILVILRVGCTCYPCDEFVLAIHVNWGDYFV